MAFGFATQACFFLLHSLGFDALVFLALRTDRIGLGQIDIFARACRPGATTVCSRMLRTRRYAGLAVMPTLGPAIGFALAIAVGRCSGMRPLRSPALARPIAAGSWLATVAMRTRCRPCVGFAFGLGADLKPNPSNWSRKVSLMAVAICNQ